MHLMISHLPNLQRSPKSPKSSLVSLFNVRSPRPHLMTALRRRVLRLVRSDLVRLAFPSFRSSPQSYRRTAKWFSLALSLPIVPACVLRHAIFSTAAQFVVEGWPRLSFTPRMIPSHPSSREDHGPLFGCPVSRRWVRGPVRRAQHRACDASSRALRVSLSILRPSTWLAPDD